MCVQFCILLHLQGSLQKALADQTLEMNNSLPSETMYEGEEHPLYSAGDNLIIRDKSTPDLSAVSQLNGESL